MYNMGLKTFLWQGMSWPVFCCVLCVGVGVGVGVGWILPPLINHLLTPEAGMGSNAFFFFTSAPSEGLNAKVPL